jgi:hypothetical protein
MTEDKIPKKRWMHFTALVSGLALVLAFLLAPVILVDVAYSCLLGPPVGHNTDWESPSYHRLEFGYYSMNF